MLIDRLGDRPPSGLSRQLVAERSLLRLFLLLWVAAGPALSSALGRPQTWSSRYLCKQLVAAHLKANVMSTSKAIFQFVPGETPLEKLEDKLRDYYADHCDKPTQDPTALLDAACEWKEDEPYPAPVMLLEKEALLSSPPVAPQARRSERAP